MLGVTVLGLGSNLPLTLNLTCGGARCRARPPGRKPVSVTELAVAVFQRAGPAGRTVCRRGSISGSAWGHSAHCDSSLDSSPLAFCSPFCLLMEARPSSEAGMDLANERLHAAAQSGDLEQLQVTLGHPAPCGRCSIKRPGCVCCSCGWERGPSSRTKTGTALHSALAHGTRTGSFDCRLRPLGVFSHAQQSSPHATV